MKYTYCVYVIELNNNPNMVYVGQTCRTPEEMLAQHREGYRSSRHVRNARTARLRPDLYRGYTNIATRTEAEAKEVELADALRRRGFDVISN